MSPHWSDRTERHTAPGTAPRTTRRPTAPRTAVVAVAVLTGLIAMAGCGGGTPSRVAPSAASADAGSTGGGPLGSGPAGTGAAGSGPAGPGPTGGPGAGSAGPAGPGPNTPGPTDPGPNDPGGPGGPGGVSCPNTVVTVRVMPATTLAPVCVWIGARVELISDPSPSAPWSAPISTNPAAVSCAGASLGADGSVRVTCTANRPGNATVTAAANPAGGGPALRWQVTVTVRMGLPGRK